MHCKFGTYADSTAVCSVVGTYVHIQACIYREGVYVVLTCMRRRFSEVDNKFLYGCVAHLEDLGNSLLVPKQQRRHNIIVYFIRMSKNG